MIMAKKKIKTKKTFYLEIVEYSDGTSIAKNKSEMFGTNELLGVLEHYKWELLNQNKWQDENE